MATNYTTQASKAVLPPRFVHAGQIQVSSVFALTAALAVNDVITMAQLPIGAVVMDVIISTDTALDTNAGGSTISFQVGDQGSATRYIGTKTQGGNNVPLVPYHMDQQGGHQYRVDATSNQLLVKVQAGPATGATTGNLRVSVSYAMDN